jgi:hypothetical protein
MGKMEHEHKEGGPLDYDHITDGIYAGTNQCCAVGLSEVLKKEGITADISLEDVRLDHPFGVDAYLWLPTHDHTPPSPDQLHIGVQTLDELVRQKRKVYVHCKNGHGRASTLLAAYLIAKGKNLGEAIDVIKKGRPSIHLQDSQKEALEQFVRSM